MSPSGAASDVGLACVSAWWASTNLKVRSASPALSGTRPAGTWSIEEVQPEAMLGQSSTLFSGRLDDYDPAQIIQRAVTAPVDHDPDGVHDRGVFPRRTGTIDDTDLHPAQCDSRGIERDGCGESVG